MVCRHSSLFVVVHCRSSSFVFVRPLFFVRRYSSSFIRRSSSFVAVRRSVDRGPSVRRQVLVVAVVVVVVVVVVSGTLHPTVAPRKKSGFLTIALQS